MNDIVEQLRAPCSPNDEFIIGQWPGEEPVRYDVLRSRASDEIAELREQILTMERMIDDGQVGFEYLAEDNRRLREALDSVMVGGNHLATIIGATHPQVGAHSEAALQFYGPGHQYDAWCCWNAIMLARIALEGKDE